MQRLIDTKKLAALSEQCRNQSAARAIVTGHKNQASHAPASRNYSFFAIDLRRLMWRASVPTPVEPISSEAAVSIAQNLLPHKSKKQTNRALDQDRTGGIAGELHRENSTACD